MFIEKLNKRGIFTIKDITNSKIPLNSLQKIGIKYYTDLSKSIPRNEIFEIKNYLQSFIKEILKLVGSYRRNAERSGDIDILISCEKINCLQEISKIVVNLDIYIDTLILGKTKFSFLIKWNGIVRQVDFLLVPKKSYYTALFYFTGNTQFNQKIRGIYKKRGWLLNEYQIHKNKNEIIYPKSEQEIFKLVNLEYLEPKRPTVRAICSLILLKSSQVLFSI